MQFKFWEYISHSLIHYKKSIATILVIITVFFGCQWKHIRFSFTEANLLPDHHPENQLYQKFLNIFGEEGNIIVAAIPYEQLLKPDVFKDWKILNQKLKKDQAIEGVLSVTDLKKLVKKENPKRFELEAILDDTKDIYSQETLDKFKDELFNKLPFYKNIAYSNKSKVIQSAFYLRKEIVNTKARKVFIEEKLQPLLNEFSQKHNISIRVSGMPYIRTLNANSIKSEIALFLLGAALVTSLVFFFFFRSIRATIIALTTVVIGVMWAFGMIGWLGFEITVLTGIIPPLIIVIGIPNCVFLINKFQQSIKKHQDKNKALKEMITKVGNATLMTNLTTAAGFATFIFTESSILKEFGILASVNIIILFVLCICVISILYSWMPTPKSKHLKHLDKKWMENIIKRMQYWVIHQRKGVYGVALAVLILAIVGMFQMKVAGSLLEDIPQNRQFYKDIVFFEDEFDGIMPLEIIIDTRRKKGVEKMSCIKRIEKLSKELDAIPQLSSPLSISRFIKYAKQTYYNGNPEYYKLPSSNERNFIYSYLKSLSNTNDSGNKDNILKNYVDTTGRYARITTFMKDIGTDQMNEIQKNLAPKIAKIFPKSKYDVDFTGKALLFQKGTHYLVKNLVFSLGLAIVIIAVFMAWMFKSTRMIFISIIPNLLPLLMTAGIMGFTGVPIKPSTILVFSVAFGISVDDTIHFLAKYKQELSIQGKTRAAILYTLRETGISMFYTSAVLFFGFWVFTLSEFGGTKALGWLVSTTLLFAMLSNLILLPSLLFSFSGLQKTKKNTALKTSSPSL